MKLKPPTYIKVRHFLGLIGYYWKFTCVQVQNEWLVYSPMLIPRQFRFSLYSGAVITEGQV